MKCPLCAKEMTRMIGTAAEFRPTESSAKPETFYYCEKHGVMNKSTDLKEKVDKITRRA